MRSGVLCGLLMLPLLAGGCGGTPSPEAGGLVVFVSIAPQRYFVERIAGGLAAVSVMVEPGSDPHTYEPRPAQMAALQEASLYFTIGVPFEDVWMGRIAESNPGMRIVDTARGITRVTRDNGSDGEGDSHHGAEDPHIWLSPSLVKVQAANISAALSEIDPAHAETYAANLESFIAETDELAAGIRSAFEQNGVRKFLVFHPAWGYFADEFGLEMIAVEQGGQEPSPSELAGVVEFARREGIRVVFAQPEYSTYAAEAFAREIGGVVVLLSPMTEDWSAGMRAIPEALAGEAVE